MAHPVDADRSETDGTADASPLVVNLPAANAGDTLLMQLRANNTDVTNPSGWNQLVNVSMIATELDDDTLLITWREATGSEGATVNVTVGFAAKFSAIVWRITNAADPNVSPPQISAQATSGSTPNASLDAPSITPSGGSRDYLFLLLGSMNGETTVPPVASPANYSFITSANTGTIGGTIGNNTMVGASRQLTAASEDPPVWTLDTSETWTAYTVAIDQGEQPPPIQVLSMQAHVFGHGVW